MKTHLPFDIPRIFGADKILNHILNSLKGKTGQVEIDGEIIHFQIDNVKHSKGMLIIEAELI